MSEEYFNIDINCFSKKVIEALSRTFDQAQHFRYEFITPETLLYNIVLQPEFITFCRKKNIDQTAIENELKQYNNSLDTIPPDKEYQGMVSNQMLKLIQFTCIEMDFRKKMCKSMGKKVTNVTSTVSVVDILVNINKLDETMAKHLICKYLGEKPQTWMIDMLECYKSDIAELMTRKDADDDDIDDNDDDESILDSLFQGTNSASTQINDSSQTNKIEPWMQLVTYIDKEYLLKNPVIGRDKELKRAVRILCRKDKHNPLFIGESGVGKTAMFYALAKLIKEGDMPGRLAQCELFTLDVSAIVAGTSLHGEFERRMKLVLDGLNNRGFCILFIDDIHILAEMGGNNNSMNAADMLNSYLEEGRIRIIGTTTYKAYNKSIAGKKSFARRFEPIDIKEPSVEETVSIIKRLLTRYEWHHNVKYKEDAIRYAVEQSHILITDRCLPDKAIDIIDEAGAYRVLNPLFNNKGLPKAPQYQFVDKEVIKLILTDICRIDANALKDSNDELKNLDKRICAEIYGQDEAVHQVVRSVMMSKAGLVEADKPIASLLFVGPTGVGKTEVCKVLAKELGIELVRFDMSEYTEKHTVSKLIGSPAGYVGYEDGGLLTDAIRRTPNCVLLLDEIEKAHSDIYNILLQVMDYARLTDNKGNKVDFKNVILVMTSNAGAQFAGQAAVGFTGGESKGMAMLNTVKKTFKPEFLNRLSGTVVFNEMDMTMASMILDKKLNQLSKRLESKSVSVSLDDEAHKFLLSKGFTSKYGAREMDRAINSYLSPLLMDEILFGKLKKGGIANIMRKGDGLAIKTRRASSK